MKDAGVSESLYTTKTITTTITRDLTIIIHTKGHIADTTTPETVTTMEDIRTLPIKQISISATIKRIRMNVDPISKTSNAIITTSAMNVTKTEHTGKEHQETTDTTPVTDPNPVRALKIETYRPTLETIQKNKLKIHEPTTKNVVVQLKKKEKATEVAHCAQVAAEEVASETTVSEQTSKRTQETTVAHREAVAASIKA